MRYPHSQYPSPNQLIAGQTPSKSNNHPTDSPIKREKDTTTTTPPPPLPTKPPHPYRLPHPPSATPLVNLARLISPTFLGGQRLEALEGDFLIPKTRELKSDVSLPSLDSKLFGLPCSSSSPERRLWRRRGRSGRWRSWASRSGSWGVEGCMEGGNGVEGERGKGVFSGIDCIDFVV